MTVIDEYLEGVTPSQREVLLHIREVIKATVPESEEVIGYGMPTFKYKKKNLIHFAAFKDHLSIFPTVKPMDELGEKVAPYRTGKGTLQFSESAPLPDEIIEELVLLRKRTIDK